MLRPEKNNTFNSKPPVPVDLPNITVINLAQRSPNLPLLHSCKHVAAYSFQCVYQKYTDVFNEAQIKSPFKK